MILDLGGARVAVTCRENFSIGELDVLGKLARAAEPFAGSADFGLLVSSSEMEEGEPDERPGRGAPATVRFGACDILVTHHRYRAVLNAAERRGELSRRPDASGALEIALRLTMTMVLPLAGGLPIHGAGVVAGARGLVFFGPSEAGKTTIARACPWQVVSDELVVVGGVPTCLRRSGFNRWSEEEPSLPAPLAGLVLLAKGPHTLIEELSPAEGLRQVLHNLWIPPVPLLQREALRVAARLIESVPIFRLAWNPARPPFAEIERRMLRVTRRTARGS